MSFISGTVSITGSKFEKIDNHAIVFKSQDESSLLTTNFCYFSDIFYNENGAGICFIGQGKVNVNRVCSMNCSCGGNRGHFLYTSVSDVENAANFVSFCSFAQCAATEIGLYACELTNGNAHISCSNISQCKGANSGFRFVNQKHLTKTSFSNFENISANSYMFVFRDCHNIALAINCNYMSNKGAYFLCSLTSNLTIKECNILQNNITHLLVCEKASLVLIHCYIKDNDVSNTTSYAGSYSFNLNSMSTCNYIRNIDNIVFDSCSAIQHMISKGLCSNEDLNICKINIIPNTLPIIENYISQ